MEGDEVLVQVPMESAGGRGTGSNSSAGDLRALGQLFQIAMLKIVPRRETVVMGVDAVVALMSIVYYGQDGYLPVRRDSYFY